jgi:penicillin amidase
VRTLRREQRADVVVTSWYQAMDTLRARFPEEDPLSITWGRLHTLTLKHPMGEVPALNAVVNTGPFPMSGDKTTINCSGWSFHAPYSVEVGSSFRFVSDLRDSVVRFVIPGGNSGQPLSAHYSDQIQLALNGGMITLPWGRTPSAAFDKCLRLIPD